MNLLLIGNLISLSGCLVMVAVGLVQRKERILLLQCVQFALQGIANLVLGGVSGFMAGVVGIVRNLVFARRGCNTQLKLIFIALQVLLCVQSLSAGMIAWLPVLASCIFTWFLDLESEVWLKVVLIGTSAMWAVYDFSYMNYVSFSFDLLNMASNAVGIGMLLKKQRS